MCFQTLPKLLSLIRTLYVFKTKVFSDCFESYQPHSDFVPSPKKWDSGPFQTLSAPYGSYSMSKKCLFVSFQTAWARCGFCYVSAKWVFKSFQNMSARVGSYMFSQNGFLDSSKAYQPHAGSCGFLIGICFPGLRWREKVRFGLKKLILSSRAN